MGISTLGRSCFTNSSVTAVPNPDPSRWKLLKVVKFKKSYVLVVQYFDATNFEGIKVMVYKGTYKKKKVLDPHFSETDGSPFARFVPTDEGLIEAIKLAEYLSKY